MAVVTNPLCPCPQQGHRVPLCQGPQPARRERPALRLVSLCHMRLLKSFCTGAQEHNSNVVASFLPYYQYNSGVRYGQMGDGAGQTGSPDLLRTWVRTGHIQCVDTGPDISGHAVLLSRGWPRPGGWSLTEFDVYNGVWKINDFTFGHENILRNRMQIAGPLRAYHV